MKKTILSLLLVCSLAASLATNATSNSAQSASSADRLMRLVRVAGVSGFEGEIREEIKSQLPAWAHTQTDEIGNLIVTVGSGNPRTLVAAPLDEDGHVVSGITDGGYLRVHRVTTGASNRLFDQLYYGQPVVITNRRGEKIPAVTATLSTHLQRGAAQGETERIRTLDDLWVDLGAQSKEEVERLGIRNLDPVTLRERGQYLTNNRLAGAAMQSRAATFALLELLRASDPASADSIVFVWTAQSQFQARGLSRIAQLIKPDRVLLLGRTVMTPANSIDARGSAGQFGAGPLVAANSELKALADQNQIPAQTIPDSHLQIRPPIDWQGVKIHTLSLPVLFAQTPVETIDLRDVESMIGLVRVFTGLKASANASIGASSTRVVADDKPATDAFDILRELIEVYGVSGHEEPVRETIKRLLPVWASAQTDAKGNLSVTFGKGGKEILFVAHMDEVGYEITSIREDGTAAIRKRGGFFDSIYEAHPAIVHTARGPVNAVVAPRPNYFQADRFQPVQGTIYVYFGADSKQQTESLGVKAGDSVTVRKEFSRLASTRATGRSMDDRVGSAALIAAMRGIDPDRLNNRVTFAWVVEEEVGLNGAGFMAERFHPPFVFAVDTFVSSDSPVDPQRMAYARLGGGAISRAMDNSSITPAEMVDRIAMIARKRNIPLYIGTTGGGNDGSMFTRFGSINLPLSWPGRYSHSPVEVMDRRDLESLIQLIIALAQEF